MQPEDQKSSLHFTYEEGCSADLCQGDLIARSPDLEDVLKDIHRYYGENPKYKYFVVLTQSCDLVRRKGGCKAHYISIAAVRPIGDVVERYVEPHFESEVQKRLRFTSSDKKEKVRMALERLINNNEASYFYFKEEPRKNLYSEVCAFLGLSIALKADLHYETLLNSRVLSLNDSFQHKLGYLVGSSYSRIGTHDWESSQQKQRVDRLLEDLNVSWIPKPNIKAIEEHLNTIAEPGPEDLEAAVKQVKAKKNEQRDALLGTMRAALSEVGVDDRTIERFMRRVENATSFKTVFSR